MIDDIPIYEPADLIIGGDLVEISISYDDWWEMDRGDRKRLLDAADWTNFDYRYVCVRGAEPLRTVLVELGLI